jgi:hypothetical protein
MPKASFLNRKQTFLAKFSDAFGSKYEYLFSCLISGLGETHEEDEEDDPELGQIL